MFSLFINRKRKREEMEVTANPIADDKEVEVTEEHYLLNPGIMDGQDDETKQIHVRESKKLKFYCVRYNRNKAIINFINNFINT